MTEVPNQFRLRRILGLCIIAACWELASKNGILPAEYLPPPSLIAMALLREVTTGDLFAQTLLTVGRAILGISLAAAVGISLAMLTTVSGVARALLAPIIEFLRPIPPAAMIPIGIFFLGIGNGFFLFTISFAAIWPIYINTANALRGVDRVLIDTGRSFGCGILDGLFLIKLPHALPEVFTGLRVGAGIGLLATIVAEMLAGVGGLGYLLFQTAFALRIPEMFAVMIVAGITGFLLNWLMLQLRAFFVGWHSVLTELPRGA